MAKNTKSKAKVSKSSELRLELTPKNGLIALALVLVVGAAAYFGFNKVKYGTFTAQAAYSPSISCISAGKQVSANISGSSASQLRIQRYGSGSWSLIASRNLVANKMSLTVDANGTSNYRAQAKYGSTYANSGTVVC